jgi:hypothetical protein
MPALHVHRSDPNALAEILVQHHRERKSTDPSQKHLGAIFKDAPGATTHTLIEQAGLAGKIHGKAQISERNANYIVNLGGASPSDITTLAIEAHQKVLTGSGRRGGQHLCTRLPGTEEPYHPGAQKPETRRWLYGRWYQRCSLAACC